MRQLLSCSNCWFNGLQSGSIGFSVGYCAEFCVVLRQPDETTCSKQLRRDLLLESALQQRDAHRQTYPEADTIVRVADGLPADSERYQESDIGVINGDPIANVVAEYGYLRTKIESLAQLRLMPGARAEVAMLSLGRAYTHRCMQRGGRWTSGVHLLWWTKQHMEREPIPAIHAEDLRYQLPVSIHRQLELEQWSVMMLRLVFISDLAKHASRTGHELQSLASLPEDAASATEVVGTRKLSRWMRTTAIPRISVALPEDKYRALACELHQE
jgi:hypothetical protein